MMALFSILIILLNAASLIAPLTVALLGGLFLILLYSHNLPSLFQISGKRYSETANLMSAEYLAATLCHQDSEVLNSMAAS